MSDLFEYAPIEDVDREFMDYVGVHPLSWYDCKEPTAAFVESKYTTEIVDELLAACELGKDWTPSGAVRCAAHELGAFGGSFDALRKLLYEKADAEEAAIARTKGDDDA